MFNEKFISLICLPEVFENVISLPDVFELFRSILVQVQVLSFH